MIITKELKSVSFEYDESEKSFTISSKDGNVIELNKVQSFAFMRFIIRISQRNWFRKKPTEEKLVLDENWEVDTKQLEILMSDE